MPGAEKFVQLNTNVTQGKKIKVFESTDSESNVVETQGVVIANSDGDELFLATEVTLAAIQALLVAGIPVSNWPEQNGAVQKKLYDINDPLVYYIGSAPLGTASSASAWRIKRVQFDVDGNPTVTEWSAATAVWDNRAGEAYS